MFSFRKLLILLSLCSTTAFGSTFRVNTKRVVSVVGEVDNSVIPTAQQIEKMSRTSKEPIDIIINSPGGSVVSGLVFLSAMKVAKERGVKFRCVTTLLSASMAFFFLANCDERYALPNAFLLWHPIATSYRESQRSDTLIHDANWMDGIELLMINDILPALNIPRSVYMYHREHETLWTAALLELTAPDFLEVVDDVRGLDGPFSLE